MSPSSKKMLSVNTMKTTSISFVRSAFRRAGEPVSNRTGRCLPYGSTQVVTRGWSVWRVGCSDHVAVAWTDGYVASAAWASSPRNTETERLGYRLDDARAILQAAGIEVNNLGSMLYVVCPKRSNY